MLSLVFSLCAKLRSKTLRSQMMGCVVACKETTVSVK